EVYGRIQTGELAGFCLWDCLRIQARGYGRDAIEVCIFIKSRLAARLFRQSSAFLKESLKVELARLVRPAGGTASNWWFRSRHPLADVRAETDLVKSQSGHREQRGLDNQPPGFHHSRRNLVRVQQRVASLRRPFLVIVSAQHFILRLSVDLVIHILLTP